MNEGLDIGRKICDIKVSGIAIQIKNKEKAVFKI